VIVNEACHSQVVFSRPRIVHHAKQETFEFCGSDVEQSRVLGTVTEASHLLIASTESLDL